MDHSLEDLFEIMRIVSDSSSSCGNRSENASEWCDHYDTCNECRAALIDAIERKIADEYVRLPKDADDEPIHVGDELHDDWHEQNQGEVEWLMLDHHGWWFMFKNNCERFYVQEFHEWRHYHASTVEEVLQEFARRVTGRECMTARPDVLAEYAAKLRLAGDAE